MATVYFDMDGTVYDLYGQPNWLERITTLEDMTAYCAPNAAIYPYEVLRDLCDLLVEHGHTVGVITWLAYGSSKEYDNMTRIAKRMWLDYYMPAATEIHIVKYGTPKHHVCNAKTDAIIVDDNEQVCMKWTRGAAIDGSKHFIKELLDTLGMSEYAHEVGTRNPIKRSN